MSEIEDLREKVSKLKALLDDPEPGIVHWQLAFLKLRREVAEALDDKQQK